MLYVIVNDFLKSRAKAREEYLEKLESLKNHEGSEYYRQEKKKAQEKRDQEETRLKNEAKKAVSETIRKAREANSNRPIKAPTEEQLRVLQVLKMRESVTTDELETAANALAGCGVGLEVLREIAHKNGLHLAPSSGDLSQTEVDTRLQAIERSCLRLINDGTTTAGRRAAEYAYNHYGVVTDPDTMNQTKPFESETAFNEYVGLTSGVADACAGDNG